MTRRVASCVAAALAVGIALLFVWRELPARSRRDGPHAAVVRERGRAPGAEALRAPVPADIVQAPAAPAQAPENQLCTQVAGMQAEFDQLRSLPDDIENLRRSAELENEFNAMLDGDLAALLLQRMPVGWADTYFGCLALRAWAAADRDGAAAWMEEHPSASPVTAQALAEGWLAEDRQGLLDYLDRQPAGPWKHQLAESASEDALVAKDPAQGIALLDRVSGSDTRRDQLYDWQATAWARQDADAAAAWAEATPDPSRRERLLADVAIGRAHADPVAAADWVIARVHDSAALETALTAIARIWAAQDADAASQWVARFPPGRLRDEAAAGVAAVAAKPE